MNRIEGMYAVRLTQFAHGVDENGGKHLKKIEKVIEVTPHRLAKLQEMYPETSTIKEGHLQDSIALLGQAYEQFTIEAGKTVRHIIGEADIEAQKVAHQAAGEKAAKAKKEK